MQQNITKQTEPILEGVNFRSAYSCTANRGLEHAEINVEGDVEEPEI